MNIRILIAVAIVHALAGLCGFLIVNGWGLSIVDAGSADPGVLARGLGWTVNYVLLQPIAHWVIEAASFAWWTWSGLTLLVIVIGLNTLALVAVVYALWSRFDPDSSIN